MTKEIDAGESNTLPGLRGVALGERPGSFDISFGAGKIVSITPSGRDQPAQGLALPAFVNFHAHADRSFAAPGKRPASLADAVAAARAERVAASVSDIQARAHRFLSRSVAHGTALVRTHTDVDTAIELRAIDGVLAAAAEIGDAIDVELVAFANASADPVLRVSRDLLTAAVRRGAKIIGAVPALCERPLASAESLLDLARDLHVDVDLHLDEHLDVSSAVLEAVVDAVVRRGLEGRATFSHCCVLSVMDDATVTRVLEKMALARIVLSVQPGANLYLQDRGVGSPRRRGIPPVLQAMRAGVDVRFGTDNVRDWFIPLGDADPLDEGRLGVLGAHVEGPGELMAAMCGGRRELVVGDSADVVLIPADSFDDALARRPPGRMLVRGGRVVWPPSAT